ncbi:zinc ribbon domain-containing protein [Actinoplanes sp. G11-F43]|uniref:zinc ribbon domain-containing protein n=1 Tax=Actinoplanes sp. G11-F43 TaxID=3424130 RepID=UPI003D34435F
MFCTACGYAIPVDAHTCTGCGTPTGLRPVPARQYATAGAATLQPGPYLPPVPAQVTATAPVNHGPGGATHWMLPVGRSWQSIAAGYVALFAIVVWPLGPVALGLGGWALVRARRENAHGTGRAVFAVIVGVLSTLLLAAVLTTL